MNRDQFRDRLKQHHIELNQEQLEQFDLYYRFLVDWNQRMNLTSITDEEEVYLKHFYDSITAVFYANIDSSPRVVDVGAGAGFPSLPIKIAFPDWNVTIVDSLNKRITFLNALASELDLTGVAFYHDRAEAFAQKKEHRQSYDVAMARAVARLPVLSELCLPLVRKGGTFVAMKGSEVQDELTTSNEAIRKLGGEIVNHHSLSLPEGGGDRNIIIMNKQHDTPKKYPRKPGMPNKQPL
ncbi:16S rRNA (guanine(527)-N(7))-methyltransferase RsmG [Texcoconibacillus texcoconensis]|uniref:Ribosomal RNA small subunit methyltransferase G n=1 Tax=Texcoconibacillus texcoconensis TaxID=1095777 RepID=A0A840QTB0_9BACI|nr:16S rRNA (guanine(527)-N(7))-methyltransferase RsmG [Texcoconibacillus texcoconensis]MBB5174776.1 16S rRNA (guanine527-N7)-methyltransferase [Texcoconibacillus texcoconensis]